MLKVAHVSRDSLATLHPQPFQGPHDHDVFVALVDVGWGVSRDPLAVPQAIVGPTNPCRGEDRRAQASSSVVGVVSVSRDPLAPSRPDSPDGAIVTSSSGTGLEASATVSEDPLAT